MTIMISPKRSPKQLFLYYIISMLVFLPTNVSSQAILPLPEIPATQCVLAIGASDINGDLQVDRFEFNQVILEVLSGCTLHDETISEWNAIFDELACLCQDYDDDTCCTVGPKVVRPGRYPNEYTFRMCERLQEAVASQCVVFVPTLAPVLDIVGAPTMAPTGIAADESDGPRSRLLIAATIVLSIIIALLFLCLSCILCYMRGLHLRRVDEQGTDEYEGQAFANTVAKGTLGAGGSDILLEMESQASSIEKGSPSLDDERPSDVPEEIVSSSGDSGTERASDYLLSRNAPEPASVNNDVSLENDSGWEEFDSGSSTDPEYVGEVDMSADEGHNDDIGSIDGPNIYDSTSSDDAGISTDDGNDVQTPTEEISPIVYGRSDEDPEDIVSNPEATLGEEAERK